MFYSALVLELVFASCLELFQPIASPLRMNMNPDTNFESSRVQ